MRSLADHCVNSRIAHPEDHLLVMLAIDGTILDMGHLVSHVLNEFDRVHGIHLFDALQAEDIDVHENEIETLLDRRRLLAATREEVLACTAVVVAGRQGRSSWRTAPRAACSRSSAGSRSSPGPAWRSTPASQGRCGTRRCARLNGLGREYKVALRDELLLMNPDGWEVDVAKHKVAGIRHLQQAGYRVVAAVDNEPEAIEALGRG